MFCRHWSYYFGNFTLVPEEMYNCHPVYTNNDQYYLFYYSFSMEGWRVGTRSEYTSGYTTYYSYSYNMYQYSYTTGHRMSM